MTENYNEKIRVPSQAVPIIIGCTIYAAGMLLAHYHITNHMSNREDEAIVRYEDSRDRRTPEFKTIKVKGLDDRVNGAGSSKVKTAPPEE